MTPTNLMMRGREALAFEHGACGGQCLGDVEQRRFEQAAQRGAFVDQAAEGGHLVHGLVECVLLVGQAVEGRGVAIDQATAVRNCRAA